MKSSLLIRNILAVASGTAAAQVVVFAFSPLITRIYSPEVFGLQGIFVSLISILSPVIALRYPMAIIISEHDSDSQYIARLSLLIAFTIACLLFVILLVGRQWLSVLLGAEALGGLILFLPLALFSVALQDVANFRAARQGSFRLVGAVAVLQAFITNTARVLGGLFSPVAVILVVVTALAPALKAAMLWIGARREHPTLPPMTKEKAIALLKQQRDFPFYRMPTDIVNAVSESIPLIMLAGLISPTAAGLYALARSAINLPLKILGTALGNVLYARFAELQRDRMPLLSLVVRATLFQLLVPGVLLGISSIFFPDLFAFLFGEIWRPSGEFAQWMSLWAICALANVPTVRALPVIKLQGWHFLFNILILIMGFVGILLGFQAEGTALGVVAYFSLATAVALVLQILTYLAIIRFHDRKVLSAE